jgi:hypothetical protein
MITYIEALPSIREGSEEIDAGIGKEKGRVEVYQRDGKRVSSGPIALP